MKNCAKTLEKKLTDNLGYFRKRVQIRRLEQYAEIISSVINSYNRKSHDKTMMVKGTRKAYEDTTNRKTHQEDLVGIATIIAKKKGLSEKIVAIMAANHDIGHTPLGHSGEWWISNVLEDLGLGVFCHNAIGASELIYRHDVYNEILEKIQHFYPNTSEAKLKRIKDSLWLIMDAINAHNGEKASIEFIPKSEKTEEDFLIELNKCYTTPGFDRTIEPATSEGCLMRLADQISYVPFDMADGLREKFISGIDEDYIVQLGKLGISRGEIERYVATGRYNDLAKCLRDIFTEDLEKNSTKKRIAMSPEVFQVMKDIKKINDKEIVNFVLQDVDLKIYPQAVRKLMENYQNIILKSELLTKVSHGTMNVEAFNEYRSLYGDSKYMPLIEYVANMSKEEYEQIKGMVGWSIVERIEREQQMARDIVQHKVEYKEEEGFSKRDNRIKGYVKYYEKALEAKGGEYSKKDANDDVLVVMSNICGGKFNDNYVSIEQGIAVTIGANYLASLSDREFIEQLIDYGIINKTDEDNLMVKYKELKSVRDIDKIDSNWEKVRDSFEENEK